MADTIDPKDLYSGVDYNVMQWIIKKRANLRMNPAFAHETDEALDKEIIKTYFWPSRIGGTFVSKEKMEEYSHYLTENHLNTPGKVDCDYANSVKKSDEVYRDSSTNLVAAKADYKTAKSAKNAANARIFGWNLARVTVPLATLAAIGGGVVGLGALLTSSAFAAMLGGTVGVGIFGLAAVGTACYLGYNLVKSAIKWLSNKSKAKKAKAIEDKKARLQDFEKAKEAMEKAEKMVELRDKTQRKNNKYKIPGERAATQSEILNKKNKVTQLRADLTALKTGKFEPLKAKESTIESMDFTTVSSYITDIGNMLNTASPNIASIETSLDKVQADLTALDKYAGQEEQVSEIINTIAEIRSTLIAPIKTEAEALRGKAQTRSDSITAGFTGAKRTVSDEISRIRTKFNQMKSYEIARKRNLNKVSSTNRLADLKNIAKDPSNADKYTETELTDMLTDLSAIDLSKLSSGEVTTFSDMIKDLTNAINIMKGSNIIDKNRQALQLCKDKIAVIEPADAAKIKIERKRVVAENAVTTVQAKIDSLATLTTHTDVRSKKVTELNDAELAELINLEPKIVVDYTKAERKITDLQAIIDANEDALRADTYTTPAFNLSLADKYESDLDVCKDQVQIIKDKIQEAKEEQAKRASGISVENAVIAAENAFTTISSTLTTFEGLLAETDVSLKAKSVADLTTYITDLDAQNATISAVNWSDLQTRINNAVTAAGGTVDATLQARIGDVKNNIAKVTTALGKYAGKKATAQNIKVQKENESTVVRNLKDRKPTLMARCSDVATKLSSELPKVADHIADPDKMLTDGTDLVATTNSIHTIQREASDLRNDLQALITDINKAITSGDVSNPANITELQNLVNDIQNEQAKIDKTLVDLATYEPLIDARRVRGGGAGGGTVVSPMTEDEFNAIIANAKQGIINQRNRMLGIKDSPALGKIDTFEQWLNNLQYAEHKDKSRKKFESMVRSKFNKIVEHVDTATGTKTL